MPRKLKTNGIYNITCAATGEPAGTTPAVFAARAGKYGVTIEVLKDNYIGRTGAKLLKTLVNEKGLSAADAVSKIRQSFNVTATNAIADSIINKIVAKSSAKVSKAKASAEFELRKAAAMQSLLGSPAPKADQNKGEPAPKQVGAKALVAAALASNTK